MERFSTLTGNQDTDMRIILSLGYEDMHHICISDYYTVQLCKNSILLQHRIKQAQNKSSSIIDIAKTRKYGLNLQMNNEKETFDPFLKILLYIRYYDEHNNPHRDDEMTVQVYKLIISRPNEGRKEYVVTMEHEAGEETYYMSEKQLTEFLTVCYYNKLILIL